MNSTVGPGDLVTYRQYVAAIVRRYANNPTVAMWQLVNEGEAVNDNDSCNEQAAHSALLAFSNDVGGLVHSIDPNHLVSLGTLQGWAGSGEWSPVVRRGQRRLPDADGVSRQRCLRLPRLRLPHPADGHDLPS